MKKIFASGFLVSLFVFVTSTFAADNILIVIDASGSMLETFGNTNRMIAAKSAVSDLLASLDPSIKVALRPYAEIKKTDKVEACLQTTLAIPFTSDRDSVKTKVNTLQAVGSYTPTAYALTQAKNDFVVGGDNALILLTDGKETCGGDPALAAQALLDAGIKVKTYVIGIDVDAEARAQLVSVAEKGGGKYFDATDATSLAASLKSIQSYEKPIDKTNTDHVVVPIAVRGGNGFETAVPITAGLYHLDHDQKLKEFDYFIFDNRKYKNKKITFKVTTGSVGVRYDAASNTFRPVGEGIPGSDRAYIVAGLRVLDSRKDYDWVSVQPFTFKAKQNNTEFASVTEKSSWGFSDDFIYILVGYSRLGKVGVDDYAMSKNATFSIEVPDEVKTLTPLEEENRTNTKITDTPIQNSNPEEVSALPKKNDSGGFLNLKALLVIFGIIGFLVLVLIIVIVVLIRSRKKLQNETPQIVNTPTPPTPPLA